MLSRAEENRSPTKYVGHQVSSIYTVKLGCCLIDLLGEVHEVNLNRTKCVLQAPFPCCAHLERYYHRTTYIISASLHVLQSTTLLLQATLPTVVVTLVVEPQHGTPPFPMEPNSQPFTHRPIISVTPQPPTFPTFLFDSVLCRE